MIPVWASHSGPDQSNWDISIAKTTKVGGLREDATLEFRTEFFNTFNHPQFGQSGCGIQLGVELRSNHFDVGEPPPDSIWFEVSLLTLGGVLP